MNKNKLIDLINEPELKIYPVDQAETIPSAWYTEKIFYEFELNNLFNTSWQIVGHTTQLKKSGDYILFELHGNPIIIIKDENDIRAFYNVCKHRGGPLAFEEGNTKLLQCKYHGWTYKLDGSIHKQPNFRNAEHFNKKDFCLSPVNFTIWEGLIFAALNDPAINFSKVLSGIKERITPIDVSKYKFYKRIKYKINCNWKVYVDNYLEGYHLPFVHPGLSKVLDAKDYITETSDYYSLQYSPLKENNLYGRGEAYYYFIFPNIMLNILPGRLQTNLVQQINKNQSLVIFDYYFDDVTSSDSLKRIEKDIRFSDEVQQEDIMICEKVQKGLESKGYEKGRFSPHEEVGVYHFQTLLKNFYSRVLNNFT
jgi:phenylpropionate dioxygenase-like ring-hydroxylating dioxygenase large terminal subunit